MNFKPGIKKMMGPLDRKHFSGSVNPIVSKLGLSATLPEPCLDRDYLKESFRDFPGGAVVKNPPANAEDTGSSPGLGRSHISQSNKPMRHNY